MKSDGMAVNQKHYRFAPVELIEILQMYLDPKEFQGFLLGNVLKYLLRLGRKDETGKEVDKAFQYLLWLRQAVNGENINPREK